MPYQYPLYQSTWNNPYPPEGVGYMPMRPMMGYDGQGGNGMSGYRDSDGRYASRPSNMGYDGGRYGYDMQALRDAIGSATPEEREKMQRELRQMLGM